jgi:hypothetical protein
VSKQQLRGTIVSGADVGDFVFRRFRVRIGGEPGYAEICKYRAVVRGREEEIAGFDIAVDDTEGVEVGERGEEVVQDFCNSFTGRPGGGEERCKGVREKGEDQNEGAGREEEGVEEGDNIGMARCGLEEACFAFDIVGRLLRGDRGDF